MPTSASSGSPTSVEAQSSRSLRRELLRWRELLRALLLLTPAGARQVPFLTGASRA